MIVLRERMPRGRGLNLLRGVIQVLSVVCCLVARSFAAEQDVPETPRALPTEQAIARTLASPRYDFCSDPKYPLLPDEIAWCAYLPRSPDPRATRCPGYLAACSAGATADLLYKQKPIDIRLPDFGGVGRVVLWTLAAGAAAILVFLLVRYGLRLPAARRSRRSGDQAVAADTPVVGEAPDQELERDVERLLARARAAAAAGDFATAVVDLHAALLRRLAGDGHVRIHPSATNGDYVRELRGRAPALAGPVGDVVRDVETAEFGVAPPNETTYHGLLGRITPLLLRSGGTLTVLLLSMLGLPSCSGSLRSDWSASPSGTAAVADFLTSVGIQTRERIASLGAIAKNQDKDGAAMQVVLLSGAEVGDAEWAALRTWLDDEEHTLILATGARALPDWLANIEVVRTGAAEEIRATSGLSDAQVVGLSRGRVPGTGWIRAAIAGPETLIARGKRAYAILVPTDAGRVIALADDRLFTNASLAVGENAALLEAVVRFGGGGPTEFVGEDTGVVAPSPLASVSRGRLAPFVAQLGACLILFLLMKGRAFGRLVDRDVAQRRVFSEHVRALGTQYARARGAGHVLGSYATWALDRLRERIRMSGDRGIGDLSAAVAARTDRPLGQVARILFSARKDGDGGTDFGTEDRGRSAVAQHLAMMRDLRQLLIETSASAPGRATAVNRHQSQNKGRPRS